MTNGQTRFTFKIEFDDIKVTEIKTDDYKDGLKKARKVCEDKFK